MSTPITPQSLIEQILQIQQMEHGSLSVVGQGPNGPYFNLNSWENDKNCCRYVPQDKLPAVQQAIDVPLHENLGEDYRDNRVEMVREYRDRPGWS